MLLTLDLLSHWSPCPFQTRDTLGPNTNTIVVVVDNCVLTKPSKYLISGPAWGKRNTLSDIKIDINSRKNIQIVESKTHWNAIMAVLTIPIL